MISILQRGGNLFEEFDSYNPNGNENGPSSILFFWLIIAALLIMLIKKGIRNYFPDIFYVIIFTSISSTLLLLAPLMKEEKYFEVIRWIVSISSVALLYLSILYHNNKITTIIRLSLFGIIVMFNPAYPIYLKSRVLWFWLDLFSILAIISNCIYSYRFKKVCTVERENLILDKLDEFPAAIFNYIFKKAEILFQITGTKKIFQKYGDKLGQGFQAILFIGCLVYAIVIIGFFFIAFLKKIGII